MEQVSGGINPGGSNVGLRFPLGEPVKEVRDYGNIKLIRSLIWIYFFLLIFEGFLRMVLPSMSNALLVVRDPFLLVAYLVALISRVFPWNKFVIMFWILGLVTLFFGLAQNPGTPLVSFFGFRTAFLHLPLMFLMQGVMDERDVIAFGRWFLILAIPIAILMAMQFNLGRDHWLNRGLDMQFEQIDSAAGKIRPPGTFTYTLGPSIYYSFVTAFLMYGQFHKGVFKAILVTAAVSATCLALAVSGSRSALGLSGVVILIAVLSIGASKPQKIGGIVKFLAIVSIGLIVASQFSVFSEGADVFSQRIEGASKVEGGFIGFADRAFGDYLAGFRMATIAEPTGAGIGVGTNAGSVLLVGKAKYLLAEGEWARMVLELGPFMGLLFLSMRVGLTGWMLAKSIGFVKSGFMLPILLFGCSAFNMLAGQWGQSTALGFSVFGAGLCLAAMNIRNSADSMAGTPT